ncbi:hypothetical protein MLD38_031386 [Melastoma candidum]|nr:hypothetical protein MLD38_031386 [Melastoma candidum]
MDLADDDMRDLILCIKSSFTYAAKLVSTTLVEVSSNKDQTLILGSFRVSNNLLDLIARLESFMGSGVAARLVGVVKSWLPDLVMGLGSPYLLNRVNNDISLTFSEIKQNFPFWPSLVARIELLEPSESIDSTDEKDNSNTKSEHPVFRKLMEMVFSLARANRSVQDALGVIFMAGAASALESDDFDSLFMLLRFLTQKLVGEEDVYWDRLDAMAHNLQELFPLVVNKLGERRPEEAVDELAMARAVLEPVWANRYGTGKSSWMEE